MNEQFIRQIPLFQSLPEQEIRYLENTLRINTIPPGEIFLSEGDPSNSFCIILDGQVEVIKALATPGEHLLAVLGPGEFLGEMSLFYQNLTRSASTRAQTWVRILEITRTNLENLLRRNPELVFQIMPILIQRLRNTEEATIHDLLEKNSQLEQAYRELKIAQDRLIEQEKLEHELELARRIQESILPKEVPLIPGWQMAAFWQPAHAVSGDFYDFIRFSDERLAIIVGDVTGKGVPASLVMATTRAVLRATANPSLGPGEVLERVNNQVSQDMVPGMFVTCFYAVLDPHTGCLCYANAGHDLPLKHSQAGVMEVRATGMPLGLMEDMLYEEGETSLEAGDSLLLYSDGLVEAHNPQREMFGMPRLIQLVGAHPGGPELISFLLQEMASFTGPEWEQEDDVTLVVVQRM